MSHEIEFRSKITEIIVAAICIILSGFVVAYATLSASAYGYMAMLTALFFGSAAMAIFTITIIIAFHRFRKKRALAYDLEPNIKPLVDAVNRRYKTQMSCEGHTDHGCPYPWIDLDNFQDFGPFKDILEIYNSSNSPTWVLHGSHYDTTEKATVQRLMPECRVFDNLSQYRKETMDPERLEKLKTMARENFSLETFQDSAKILAQFLKDNWEKNITANASASEKDLTKNMHEAKGDTHE